MRTPPVTTGGSPVPPAPRPMPRWRQVLLGLAASAWRLVTRQRALGSAPRLLGQPPAHPESMRDRLPRRDERWLTALDRELWPEGDCADITQLWRLS
jgi:hypothetical protein